METRANFLLVGIFVVATIAAAVRFAFFVLNPVWTSDGVVYELRFSTPAVGLSLGTPVYFNGLKIGQVIKIKITPDAAGPVALAKLDQSSPIASDVKARLKQTELMGAAFISLEGASAEAPRLTPLPGQPYPRLLVEDARRNYPDFRELWAHFLVTFENLQTALHGAPSALSAIKWRLDAVDEALQPLLRKPGDPSQATSFKIETLMGAADRLDRLNKVLEQFAKSGKLADLAGMSASLNKMSSSDLEKFRRLATELREKINLFDEKIRALGLQPISADAKGLDLPNHK